MGATGNQPSASLLERDRELERLESALRAARDASGALVVIEGTAGIGKTALLRHTLRRAEAAGIAVASARGSELEIEFAFGVVRQLLEPVVLRADATRRAELLAGAAALAAPLFEPASLAEQERGPATDLSFSVLHGLFWLCWNLAQSRPLLLAVDDVHWADLASLRFLAYLGQRLDGLPLTLLVAARPAETASEDELLGRIRRELGATVLAPAPLSTSAVATLIAGGAKRDPDAAFVRACRRATGGVPLLVRELVRALGEQDVEPLAVSVGRVEQLGPRTIARYVVARVRRLAPAAESLARAAAVLAADAELPRVIRLAELGGEEAFEALDALTLAGVIASTRPLEFAHPVVRASIYGDLAPGERSRLHAHAAALLAEDGADEERIASHLLATEPAGDARLVEVMRRIARAAVARGAPGSAAAYLERALAEPPPAAARGAVLQELGFAELHSGRTQRASAHLREAYNLAEPGRERALIAQELAGCLRLEWRHREASEVTGAALAQLDADDDLALALRAELVLLEALEPTVHGTVARRPPPSPRRSPGAAKYLAALAASELFHGAASAERTRELVAGAREAGIVEDLEHGGSLWINAVAPLIIADGFALADEMLDEAFDAARRHASMIFTMRALVTRSMLRFRQGALPEAEVDARTALDAARDTGLYFPLLSLAVLNQVQAERGDTDAAEDTLRRAGMGGDIADTFIHNWVLAGRARVRLAQGRVDDAIADFEELGLRNELRGQSNPAVHAQRSGQALALLRRGDVERARTLAAAESALARDWGARRAAGVAVRVLGLCEEGGDRIARLRESVDMLDGSGAVLEHAHSLVELGSAIRRAGRRAEAQDPLRHGMDLAHRCGAGPLVERAREELLATGARPRRIVRSGVDALTPSESRIARMAAEGLTNREIAQALFVTPRTVESHLTHVFQKLDIAARSEIAAQLAATAG